MSRRTPSFRPSARAAAVGTVLLLGGCHYASSPLVGFGGFIGDTHTFSKNPHLIPGGDENVRYSEGGGVTVQPLLPEPGNIWPGPPAPIPTLTDVEKQQNQLEPQLNQPSNQPPPANTRPPAHRPIPRGSSTPPGPAPSVEAPPPAPPPAQFSPLPSPAPSSPPVINTPSGPLIPNGAGTAGSPGGGTSIVVPNGNGTSTVIGPDGSTTTIPTPK